MHTPLRLTAFCLTAGFACPAAIASNPTEPRAEGLVPLEARALVEAEGDHDLQGIAARINRNVSARTSPPEGMLDPTGLPIVQDIVDSEGNVNLPMGIRFYDTMGDMSVGFGSDF